MDVARYARHIALPEVGPDGQARIVAARVAVVGADRAAETAALYLSAAGARVTTLPASPAARPGEALGADADADADADAERWRAQLAGVALVVRSGFDDDAMAGAAARLGLPVIVVRARGDVVDMVTFARRAPEAGATIAAPVAAAAAPEDGPTAVLAGTLAAAEALHLLAGGREGAPPIRHLRLPLDGGEPRVQAIGSPT